MPENLPFRIKSPQLYRLSYRPKYVQPRWNAVAGRGSAGTIVSAVYPDLHGIHLTTTVPS